MTATFNSLSITSLCEVSFIGGTYKELTFDVFDASGTPIDISTFTCSWVLCPYGQPDYVALSKTGVYDTTCTDKNRFTVYLYSNDTIALSGKYVQQPIIVANPGYEFRLAQGYINIMPANAQITVSDTNTLAEQVDTLIGELSGSVAMLDPVCGLFISTGSYLTSSGAYTGLSIDRVVFDDGEFTHPTSTSSISFPETGVYVIECQAGWTSGSFIDGIYGLITYVNGTWNESQFVKPLASDFFGTSIYMTLVTKRNKGEAMQFATYQTSGSNIACTGKVGIVKVKNV